VVKASILGVPNLPCQTDKTLLMKRIASRKLKKKDLIRLLRISMIRKMQIAKH
jgi:hypothetical protein